MRASAVWLVVLGGCTVNQVPDAATITLDVEARAICLDAGCELSKLDGRPVVAPEATSGLPLEFIKIGTCGNQTKLPPILVRHAAFVRTDGGATSSSDYVVLRGSVVLPRIAGGALYAFESGSTVSVPGEPDLAASNDGGVWTFRYPSDVPNVGVEEVHRFGAGSISVEHTWNSNCPIN